MTKSDLTNLDDIKVLVNTFYKRIRQPENPLAQYFAHLQGDHWQAHLEKMYRFWSDRIFGTAEFAGSPPQTHATLHQRIALSDEIFDLWLTHWHATVDDLFVGPTAEVAKARAGMIKQFLAHFVLHSGQPL